MVQENHATVKLDLSVASRGMKTCSETRIELRNLQILKKLLDNSSQFLSSEQPSEPKNLDVALNIARVEKIHTENLRLWSVWRPFDSSFERKGAIASVTVKICVLYVPVNSKTAHPPPPQAIPGHLTRVKLRTVGNLTQNEARPVGHLTFVSKRLSAVGNKRISQFFDSAREPRVICRFHVGFSVVVALS